METTLSWALKLAYPAFAIAAIWKRRLALPTWTTYLVAISVSAWLYRVPWTIERVIVPDTFVMTLRTLATVELMRKLLEWEPERHAKNLCRLLMVVALLGVAPPLLWGFYRPTDIWQAYKLVRVCLHVALAFGFGTAVLYLWENGQKTARYVRQYSAIWMLHLACYAAVLLSTSEEWWQAVETLFRLVSLLCIGLWLYRTLKPLETRL